ncbi:MAG TPA: SCO6880 family protein, partial [Acidimicrobiales bacterium]|nr:SCO6880 family protein [Acidimicrobiales bacterium]
AGPEHQALGVLYDRRAATFTAALVLEGHSFALLGGEEKERRVTGWSGVLAALAREGSPVHRIQWLAMALPDDGRAVRAYLNEWAVGSDDTARRSYAELLAEVGAETSRHVVLLAVQVRAGRRQPEGFGGPMGSLAREVANVQRLLSVADVGCRGPLEPARLATMIRTFGLADPPMLTESAEDIGEPARVCPVAAPWPMGTEAEWGRVRTDSTWHATYWVSEWPRIDVGPDFLAPLLLGPSRRSVAVVMEPVSPSRAVRAVERSRTADIADSELRRRGGFLATARRAREAELVVRRESELAEGHGSYRFSGYVTVTAATLAELEESCDATEHAAGQAHLELRRLYGDQERALLCTLPLCRGLS